MKESDYVILRVEEGDKYTVLVRDKKFGEAGTYYNSSFDTKDDTKVKSFGKKETAEAIAKTIIERKTEKCNLIVKTVKEADELVNSAYCIVKIDENRGLTYLLSTGDFGNFSQGVKMFCNADALKTLDNFKVKGGRYLIMKSSEF